MRLIDADKLLQPGYTDMFDEPITFTAVSKEAIDRMPTVEAIPINWIIDWFWRTSDVCCDLRVSNFLGSMIKEWRKENEQRQDR